MRTGQATTRDVVGVHQHQQALGELINSMGAQLRIDPDEQICGAVVLLTVEEPDGHISLRCAWSDGMSWIERIGLLRAAERAELPADGANEWRI